MPVTIVPARPAKPVIWDASLDYRDDEERLYAKVGADNKVYIEDNQYIYLNPETGEIKVAKNNSV